MSSVRNAVRGSVRDFRARAWPPNVGSAAPPVNVWTSNGHQRRPTGGSAATFVAAERWVAQGCRRCPTPPTSSATATGRRLAGRCDLPPLRRLPDSPPPRRPICIHRHPMHPQASDAGERSPRRHQRLRYGCDHLPGHPRTEVVRFPRRPTARYAPTGIRCGDQCPPAPPVSPCPPAPPLPPCPPSSSRHSRSCLRSRRKRSPSSSQTRSPIRRHTCPLNSRVRVSRGPWRAKAERDRRRR